MKTIISLFAILAVCSCSNKSPNTFDLKSIESKNKEICQVQPGTGFEGKVLNIKLDSTTQTVVFWEGIDSVLWKNAKYLVFEIWHENNFSAVLNLELYRSIENSQAIVAQSGEQSSKPRMTAKIGVLPMLKTKIIFPLEYLDRQEIFMKRFPRQLKATIQGNRMKPEDISKVAIRFGPWQKPHFMPVFEIANVYLTNELPLPFPAPENPVVDQFGQWTGKEWPGKTKSEEDLASLLNNQLTEASSVSFSENLGKYGGWKQKRFNATGFFHTHFDGKR